MNEPGPETPEIRSPSGDPGARIAEQGLEGGISETRPQCAPSTHDRAVTAL